MAEKLQFFDVKAKQKFTTADFRVETKGGRRFAVAKSPISGIEAWRILGKA